MAVWIVCGIMGRMEIPHNDDTQPLPALRDGEGFASPSLDETQVHLTRPALEGAAHDAGWNSAAPSNAPSEEPSPTDPGETVATRIGLEDPAHAGFDATIPPPTREPASLPGGEGGGQPPGMGAPAPKKGRFPSIRLMTLLGLLALVLIAAVSAMGGYASGISQRTHAQSTQIALSLQEQFDLGVQDLQAKRYELARQRFEYIIQYEPNFPGVTEKLAEVLMQINITATPTVEATPLPTPTPDTRGAQELFSQSQQSLANSDWTTAIDTLLNLRKADPNFQAVQVDGMLYLAFRQRGRDKILKDADLEGGIYDLMLAERFGPLDADSKGYLTWARLYILGASFWDVDWSQVVYYFGQVAPALPNLRDGTGWTATERYRLGLINYGDNLINRKEWCPAMQQYELALAYGADPTVQEKYQRALERCTGGQETTQPTSASGDVQPTEEPVATTEVPLEATEETPVDTSQPPLPLP
ncbi:MAG: hypothetical protein PHS96_14295 [Anaerolineales bacterium]|nr:hypothetical protein [Anaerolineales bacterium]